MIRIKPVTDLHVAAVMEIWNETIVEGGSLFWTRPFTEDAVSRILKSQDISKIAIDGEAVAGFYILHSNAPGRGSHIANALYIVRSANRRRGVGYALAEDSLLEAHLRGYKAIQFNSVVASNTASIALWDRLGFTTIGEIPEGYLNDDGSFASLRILYKYLC